MILTTRHSPLFFTTHSTALDVDLGNLWQLLYNSFVSSKAASQHIDISPTVPNTTVAQLSLQNWTQLTKNTKHRHFTPKILFSLLLFLLLRVYCEPPHTLCRTVPLCTGNRISSPRHKSQPPRWAGERNWWTQTAVAHNIMNIQGNFPTENGESRGLVGNAHASKTNAWHPNHFFQASRKSPLFSFTLSLYFYSFFIKSCSGSTTTREKSAIKHQQSFCFVFLLLPLSLLLCIRFYLVLLPVALWSTWGSICNTSSLNKITFTLLGWLSLCKINVPRM